MSSLTEFKKFSGHFGDFGHGSFDSAQDFRGFTRMTFILARDFQGIDLGSWLEKNAAAACGREGPDAHCSMCFSYISSVSTW